MCSGTRLTQAQCGLCVVTIDVTSDNGDRIYEVIAETVEQQLEVVVI